MDPVLVVLAFNQTMEIIWSLSGGPYDSVTYNVLTGDGTGYLAERLALVKR